jgi:hypothetical protein
MQLVAHALDHLPLEDAIFRRIELRGRGRHGSSRSGADSGGIDDTDELPRRGELIMVRFGQ